MFEWGAHRAGLRFAIAIVTALVISAIPAVSGAASADDPPLTMVTAPWSNLESPYVGGQIEIRAGVWTPQPTNLTYQWLLAGNPIAGATGLEYTPTTDDTGLPLAFTETATLDGYQVGVYTSPAYAVEADFTVSGLTITGTPQVGVPLTASVGDIEPTPISVRYEWVAHGENVTDPSNPMTYTPVAADIGQPVIFTVYPKLTGYLGSGHQVDSDRVLPKAFEESPAAILGSRVVGATLAVQQGWYPTPEQTDYQWLRNGLPIAEATSNSYTSVAADVGATISVSITVSHSNLATVTTTAAMAGPVTRPFSVVPRPTITGTALIGSTLTAHPGTWGPAGATFTYSWSVGGEAWTLPSPSASYVPVRDDEVGGRVSVRVTALGPGYGPMTSEDSDLTAPVSAVSAHISSVRLGGEVGLNSPVTAIVAMSPASTYAPLSYVWMLNGVVIPGATLSYYEPTNPDYLKKLSVRVSLESLAWGDAVATSAAVTIGVGEILGNPIITGIPKVGSVLSDSPTDDWGPSVTHLSHFWVEVDSPMSLRLLSTAATFTPSAAQYGKRIQLLEWPNVARFSALHEWLQSQIVTIRAGTITAVTAPTISGRAVVGAKVTAVPGSYSATGVTLHYQWMVAASATATPVAIAHATASTYTVIASQIRQFITVRVTATKTDYTSITDSAAHGPPVAMALLDKQAPFGPHSLGQ